MLQSERYLSGYHLIESSPHHQEGIIRTILQMSKLRLGAGKQFAESHTMQSGDSKS